jgi:enoyl-CoA hydratase
MAHPPAAEPVVRTRPGRTALLELNRPAALNALDAEMVRQLTEALAAWRDDPAVRSVLVSSTSPKAFCAGGDIRAVREAGMRGDDEQVRGYFAAEYALNAMIARYPKPYTALVDGYAMGGGLGVSVHGSAMVVTERALLAMPETAIGFFPDIGATYFLPRLPGSVGRYLGLTGARISGAAAVECGLATHYVPAAELPALQAELAGGADPAPALARHAVPPPPSELTGRLPAIARCFSAPGLAEVRARLTAEERGQGEDAAWARDTLDQLDRASPMSLAVTAELLAAGEGASLEDCLARELAYACKVAREPDFHEGVRALLVDKDREPTWSSDPRITI